MNPTAKPNVPGALFFGSLTAALVGGAALTAYESVALAQGWKPITQRTRRVWHEYPVGAGRVIFFAGALLAHFIWGPSDRKADDLAP